MGCGWKRWRAGAGIERLCILQMAWQEKGSVFAKVIHVELCDNSNRTVARQILYWSPGLLVMKCRRCGAGLQLGLRGRSAAVA
jgi:hypothetical protein